MVVLKKYWFPILFGIAGLIFTIGLTLWMVARFNQLEIPKPLPERKIPADKGPEMFGPERYQSLMSGRLFFGGNDPGFDIPEVQFHSRLVLWGVIKGRQAVVGFDPNSYQDTRLVSVGDVVEGDTITAIGDGYIMVKNKTGHGRIKIYGE